MERNKEKNNGMQTEGVQGKRTVRTRRFVPLFILCLLLTAVPFSAFGAGWIQSGSAWRYQNEDGSYAADAFTPDGYYIDGGGLWYDYVEILGLRVKNHNYFLTSSTAGSLTGWREDLDLILTKIDQDCGEVRDFLIEDNAVTYVRLLDGQEEQELFRLEKDMATDGYQLTLKTPLTKATGSRLRASYYDYQVLYALLSKVSRTGAMLSDAIYSSWEEKNAYGLKVGEWIAVGDSLVSYEAANRAGIYRFRPR
ncbi:MAG: hypothetical protein Q4C63_03130 [Eubacteriales bacterium]|nr:hypothetical protein [Eubacteriales bacterium]